MEDIRILELQKTIDGMTKREQETDRSLVEYVENFK